MVKYTHMQLTTLTNFKGMFRSFKGIHTICSHCNILSKTVFILQTWDSVLIKRYCPTPLPPSPGQQPLSTVSPYTGALSVPPLRRRPLARSRYLVSLNSHSICPFATGLSHRASCPHDPSMLQPVSGLLPFRSGSSPRPASPFCCVNAWAARTFCSLWLMLLSREGRISFWDRFQFFWLFNQKWNCWSVW